MPDGFGRLSLEEMINTVRRRCDLLRYDVVTNPALGSAGEELNLEQINRLVSNEDIKMYLNMALTSRSIDVATLDNTLLADEESIDIQAGIVEYEMPADLLSLRAVYFKPLGVAATQIPPNHRYMLFEMDQDNDIGEPSADVITTYRRRLNYIVLNQVPLSDNAGGLIVDYIKSMLPLLTDDQVLETPLAVILQQVVMQDATVEVVAQKMKLDTTELRLTQTALAAQLEKAILNYHTPKTIRMVPNVEMVYPPGVRRPSSWQSLGWYRRGFF